MVRKLIFIQLNLIFLFSFVSGQVSIRIFADQKPSSAVLNVTEGKYELDAFDGKSIPLAGDETVILAIYNGKIAVKTRN